MYVFTFFIVPGAYLSTMGTTDETMVVALTTLALGMLLTYLHKHRDNEKLQEFLATYL